MSRRIQMSVKVNWTCQNLKTPSPIIHKKEPKEDLITQLFFCKRSSKRKQNRERVAYYEHTLSSFFRLSFSDDTTRVSPSST